MANLPNIEVDATIRAAQTMREFQNYVSKNPVNLQIKTDPRSLKDIGNGLGRISGLASEFEKSVEAANARVLAFGSSVATITALSTAFKGLVSSTIEVEAAFKKIIVVGDQFRGLENQLGRGLFDLARQTGQSFTVASEAALEFARQGRNLNDTLSLTKDALTLAKLSGLDATKAVENLSAAFRIFSKEGLNSNQILQKLVAVDNAFAVSAGDISEAISRSAASAQNAKIPFDDLVGLITSLKEQTQLSGATIGTSLNSIFTRIQRPDVLLQLEQLDVRTRQIKDGVKGLRPAAEILRDLGKNSQALNDLDKQGLFEDIGGIYQINRLIALLGDLPQKQSIAAQAASKSRGATDEADKALKEYNKTLETSIDNFATTAKQLASNFGGQAFSGIGDLINQLSGEFQTLAGFLEKDAQGVGANVAQALAKSFGDILTGPGLVIGALAGGKFLTDFGKFAVNSFKDLFKLNETSKQQAAIQSSILEILKRRVDIQEQLSRFGDDEIAKARALESIFTRISQERAALIGSADKLASIFVQRGNKINPGGIPTRGGRAAGGFVPNLIQAEYKDVVKGVGGANPNSSIISLNNFPFGGGKTGTMIVNSSEAIMPMGKNGAAVLNQNMLDKMGYADRAARGDLPYLSPKENEALRQLKSKRLEDQKKAEREAKEAQKAAAKAKKEAEVAAEKAAKAEQKAAEKLARQELAEKEKASKEKIKAERLAAAQAKKAADDARKLAEKQAKAAQKAAEAEAKLAEEQRLAQQRSFNKFKAELDKKFAGVRSPITGPQIGFGAFGRSTRSEASSTIISQARKSLNSQMIDLFGTSLTLPNQISEPLKKNLRDFVSQQVSSALGGGEIVPGFAIGGSKNFAARQQALAGLETAQNPPISNALRLARANADFPSRNQIINQIPLLFGPVQEQLEKVRKPISDFILNTGLTALAFESVGSVIGNFSEEFELGSKKTIDSLTGAFLGLQVISQISKEYGKGGKTLLERLSGGGGGFFGGIRAGRAGEAVTGGRAARVGASLGRGIASFASVIPGIAQFTAGLFVANSLLKAFGVDVVGSLSKQLGFLTEAGQKASESISEFSQRLNKPEGKPVSSVIEDAQKRLEAAQARIELGQAGSGLSNEQAIQKRFEDAIFSRISGIQLGKPSFLSAASNFLSGGLIGNGVSEDFKKQLLAQSQALAEFNEKELREFAKSQPSLKGSADKSISQLRLDIIEFAIRTATNAIKNNQQTFNEQGFLKEYEVFLTSLTASVASQLQNVTQTIDASGKTVKLLDLQQLVRDRDAAIQNLVGGFDRIKGELNAISQSSALDAFGPATKARLSGAIELRQANLGFDAQAARKNAEIFGEFINKFGDAIQNQGVEAQEKIQTLLNALDIKDLSGFQKGIESLSGLLKGSADVKELDKVQRDAIDSARAFNTERQNELNSLQLSIALKNEEAQIIDSFNKNMLKVNASLQQFELANVRLRGQLERLDIERDLVSKLSVIGTRSPEEAFNRRSSIESNFAVRRQAIERQILNNELRIEATRQLYTSENTLAIKANTEALEKFVAERLGIAGPASAPSSGFFKPSGAQLKTIADQISGGAISAGAGTEADFVRIIREKLDSQLPENVALEYAKVLQNITFQLDNQEALFTEELKTLTEKQKAEKRLQFSLDAYRISLDEAANALEQEVKTGSLTVGEQKSRLRQAAQKRFLSRLGPEEGARYLSSGRAALDDLSDQAGQRADDFNRSFTDVVVTNFKDGLVGAIGDAISGTKSLKDSLLDAALSFANTLRDRALNNLADIVLSQFNSFGGSGSGFGNIVGALFGGVQKKASGGKVTGGSGVKDDVPTLLMGGEYVINKKSVQKYGPQFFEALNNGRVGGMATGGLFDPSFSGKAITGAGNLKKFATQNFTSGAKDSILGLGANAGLIELEPESVRLTAFGRENSLLFGAAQDAKSQALSLLFEDENLRRQYKETLKARDKAEKEKLNQLYLSLAVAAVGGGLSSFAGSGNNNFTGGGRSVGERPTSLPTRTTAPSYRAPSSATNTSAAAAQILRSLNLPSGNFNINGYNNPLLPNLRASGGVVNGNGYGDNVPAMLTGGEFVINRRASKKLGFSNLNAANSGQSIGTSEETSKELNDRVVTKLDELIQAINSTGGGVNVNIQMDSSGRTQTSEDGSQNDAQRNLKRRIRDAVVEVLQEEKRLGGVLR